MQNELTKSTKSNKLLQGLVSSWHDLYTIANQKKLFGELFFCFVLLFFILPKFSWTLSKNRAQQLEQVHSWIFDDQLVEMARKPKKPSFIKILAGDTSQSLVTSTSSSSLTSFILFKWLEGHRNHVSSIYSPSGLWFMCESAYFIAEFLGFDVLLIVLKFALINLFWMFAKPNRVI